MTTLARFEKLEITAQQVKKLLPQLQTWLAEARRRDSQVGSTSYFPAPTSPTPTGPASALRA